MAEGKKEGRKGGRRDVRTAAFLMSTSVQEVDTSHWPAKAAGTSHMNEKTNIAG